MWLQGATAPVALALHVYDVLHDAVKGPGGGCNTKTYVAIRMHKLLESTWWLIAGRLNAYWLTFNRNAVDPSGSTGRWRARVQSKHGAPCLLVSVQLLLPLDVRGCSRAQDRSTRTCRAFV